MLLSNAAAGGAYVRASLSLARARPSTHPPIHPPTHPDPYTDDNIRKPARVPAAAEQGQLKFYNPALHAAAFALPEFARQKLEQARAEGGLPARSS